jgi:hypothetical protein
MPVLSRAGLVRLVTAASCIYSPEKLVLVLPCLLTSPPDRFPGTGRLTKTK